MERYRFLALLVPLMITVTSAPTPSAEESVASDFFSSAYIQNYYLPVFGGVLLVFLVFTLINRLLKRRFSIIEFVATFFGIVLAFALIVAGFVFLAAVSVLAWATAIKDISYMGAGKWAVPLAGWVQSLVQPLLDMVFGSIDYTTYLMNILLGVLLIGGGILVVLGVVLLVKLPKGTFYGIIKPGIGGLIIKEVMKRGTEPLAPTVTFKVIDRMSNQASPDVKVILKHKEGAKVYTRYTDFNGEVVFQKIDGLFSQYYAYVEGDEDRKKYWVIRTAIGAESVT
jgi:hypothetical protein